MERLRIAHVVDSLGSGGMENGICNVANALAGSGFDIHVCCLRERGAFAERMPEPSQVRSIDKGPGFALRHGASLRRLLAAMQPDLVHTHNLGPLIYTALASRFGRRWPILHGEHAALTEAERGLKKMVLRKGLYRCCRRVHTVSRSLTDELLALGFRRPAVETVENGVDCDRFRPAAGEDDGPGLPGLEGLRIIGNVGRFGAFKRQEMLVEAFDLLAAEAPGIGLLLVGDGGPRAEAVRRRVAQSPFAERIHVAGFQQDTSPFYRRMEILAVPSTTEGMSNAILEAMASGVPVLTHDSCGGEEILGGTGAGLVRPLGDAETLAGALREMLEAPETLASMGASGRGLAVEKYSLAAMARRYGALYREIAGRGG